MEVCIIVTVEATHFDHLSIYSKRYLNCNLHVTFRLESKVQKGNFKTAVFTGTVMIFLINTIF